MYRKCFFKNKGVLSRKFVASGLAAVFSAGMFGSYAGAMGNSVNFNVINQNLNKKLLDNDLSKEDFKKGKERRNSTGLPLKNEDAAEFFVKKVVGEKSVDVFLSRIFGIYVNPILELFYRPELSELFIQFLTELTLEYFYAGKEENKWVTFYKFTTSFRNNEDMMKEVLVNGDKKIINKYKKKAEAYNQKMEEYKKIIEYVQKIINNNNNIDSDINSNSNNIIDQNLNQNQNQNLNHIQNSNWKNKLFSNWKLIVSLIGVGFVVFIVIAIILSVKGKSNTDNNNKDDEKVNPSTDPESDDENLEQKKQEQESSVGSVGTANLKAVGASVFLGGGLAGYGTYLVNEVLLKHGKSSEVKNSKNVNGKHMSLDSDGNEVTKGNEGEEKNSSVDNVEDKSAEENKSLESSEPTDTEESDSDNKKDY